MLFIKKVLAKEKKNLWNKVDDLPSLTSLSLHTQGKVQKKLGIKPYRELNPRTDSTF